MEVPRHWRLKKQRYAMVGETCPECKSRVFPPRAVCPVCSERRQAEQAYVSAGGVLALEERTQQFVR